MFWWVKKDEFTATYKLCNEDINLAHIWGRYTSPHWCPQTRLSTSDCKDQCPKNHVWWKYLQASCSLMLFWYQAKAGGHPSCADTGDCGIARGANTSTVVALASLHICCSEDLAADVVQPLRNWIFLHQPAFGIHWGWQPAPSTYCQRRDRRKSYLSHGGITVSWLICWIENTLPVWAFDSREMLRELWAISFTVSNSLTS